MTDWTLTDMAERGASETFATWPTARRVEVARNVLNAAGVPALVAEIERLRGALAAAREELAHWGWGDFHYGNTGRQEQRVVDALARIDAALNPQEPSDE